MTYLILLQASTPGRIPRISRLPERAPTPAATEGFLSTSDSWNSSSVVVVSAQEPEGDSWNSSSVVVVLVSEFFRDSWNSCCKNSKNLRGARGKNPYAQTSHSLAGRIPRTSRIWPGKNPHVKTVFCMSGDSRTSEPAPLRARDHWMLPACSDYYSSTINESSF